MSKTKRFYQDQVCSTGPMYNEDEPTSAYFDRETRTQPPTQIGSITFSSQHYDEQGRTDFLKHCMSGKSGEVDPHGKHQHETGAKMDAGKIRPSLVLGGFARALKEVCRIGTDGAKKYTDNGWMEVPNGVERYDDAFMRHKLDEWAGQPRDRDTKRLHAAHEAWNALARLDLLLREEENVNTKAA